MRDQNALLSLTDQLLGAAASPDGWRQALDAMARLFQGDHVLLYLAGTDPLLASFGLNESDLARFSSPEAFRMGAPFQNTVPVGRAVPIQALVSERDMERNDYYNEIIRPTRTFYSIHARQEAASSLHFAICRTRRAGPYEQAEARTLQLILPFLAAATELRQRLQVATTRETGLLQVIDRLDSGVILADALARPLLVNDRAARIAREGDGLLLHDAIAAATPEATRRLREAVAATASDAACESLRLGLERPSGRPPLLLTLMPIWRLGTQVPGAGAPRVAIFIKETDAPLVIDRGLLADSLRLTRRESEVAALLADGLDLAEVAERLGHGIGTTRSHLKQVFDKTGARSQAALVALVRGFGDPGPSRAGIRRRPRRT